MSEQVRELVVDLLSSPKLGSIHSWCVLLPSHVQSREDDFHQMLCAAHDLFVHDQYINPDKRRSDTSWPVETRDGPDRQQEE